MRVQIPDGADPLLHIQQHIGSPRLRATLVTISEAVWLNDSTVTPREREAARYYLAWQADCNACAAFRAPRDVPGYSDDQPDEEWYDHIPEYRTWPGFTERERLAIEFCSRFHQDHRGLAADEDLWSRMHRHFSPVEIEDLCIISSLTVASNLMRETLIVEPEITCPVPVSR